MESEERKIQKQCTHAYKDVFSPFNLMKQLIILDKYQTFFFIPNHIDRNHEV